MHRLINSTTILSLALYIVPPFAAQAQDFPTFTVGEQEVICLPNKKAECPEGAFCVVVKNPENCEIRATEAVAAAAVEAAAAAQALIDQAAADQAAADAAVAEAAAAAQAVANQAAVDAAAAEKAAADLAAAEATAAEKAAADQAAADAAAAEQAALDQAAADQAAADKAARKAARKAAAEAAEAEAAAAAAVAAAAAEAAAAEAAATTEATLTEAPAADATVDATVADPAADATVDATVVDPAADATVDATVADPAADATVAETTTMEPAVLSVTVAGQVFICLPNKDAVCPEGAVCVIAKTVKKCEARAEAKLADAATEPTDPAPEEPVVTEVPAEDAAAVAAALAAAAAAEAAAAADPNVTPVEAPVPTEEAVDTLESALDTPTASDEVFVVPEVEASGEVVVTEDGTLPADLPPSEAATVTTEVVTEADTRASTEEFAAAPATVAPGKKTGLSDFEKVGLIALGALMVGAMIKGNKQVVSNSGDRVVVRQPDGTYQVYKDDNALLREPGSTVRTETFADGSTRTIVQRVDGSQIVTIRDATGRVLQRVAYDRTGHGTVLIDDLQPEERVDVTTLPKPHPTRNQISMDDDDAALRAQLAAARANDLGRKFSLRQVRNIPEVRWLAPTIDVNNITFETGSSAIQTTEAKKLNKLGKLMAQLIAAHPEEVFLIEGHTDAVGSAASNLALSDRRAESVAKALTEYYGVPPENLVVQGYGEGELKIDTLGDERKNRRVAVRIITPLLRQSAL